jgi:hypothetical protein
MNEWKTQRSERAWADSSVSPSFTDGSSENESSDVTKWDGDRLITCQEPIEVEMKAMERIEREGNASFATTEWQTRGTEFSFDTLKKRKQFWPRIDLTHNHFEM